MKQYAKVFFCQLCFFELLPFILCLVVSFLRFEEVIKCSAHEKRKCVASKHLEQPSTACTMLPRTKNSKGKGLQQLQETDTNSQTERKRGAHPRERRVGPLRKRDVREMKHS